MQCLNRFELNNQCSFPSELDSFKGRADDPNEMDRVKEILRAQHKFEVMKDDYQKEFQAARSSEQQLVSWPAEEELFEEDEPVDHPQLEMKQKGKVTLSTKPERITHVPAQVLYEDAKDVPTDIHDTYGPYARQLGYQGQDYFD